MYTLIVKGARRATIAVHRCDSYLELREMLAVYTALGYAPEALLIEEHHEEDAA